MNRFYKSIALLLLVFLIGSTSQVLSRDLSSFRTQLTNEEIEIRKQRARETNRLQQIDSDGLKQVTYEEWVAAQGTPLPFSTKLVITSSAIRADSKICVIVNSDLYPSIETSVTQYVADLVTEGYMVEVHTMLGGTEVDLRTFLQGRYALGLDGCLLIGDLPIAWYREAYDGTEIFPCDLYYMDLDGNFYDDNADGMFEAHDGTTNPEIYVGRLTASTLTYGGDDEATLVNNYFRKNHLFRTGELFANNRALVFIDDDWTWDGDYIQDAMEYIYCQSKLYDEPTQTVASNYIAEITAGYEFVHLAAHSNPAGNWFGNTSIMYNELYALDPPCIFYSLFACSNCRFVNTDYMGGWYIFNDSFGLAATGTTKTGSMMNFEQYYEPIGQGATIGEAYFIWWDQMTNWGIDDYLVSWYYGNVLLGDPTLKSSERRPIELKEAVLPDGIKNRNYSYYFDVNGGFAPPYGWNIISGQLPNGLNLQATDGYIYGQSTESGIFNFTITAEDLCVRQPPHNDLVFGDTMEYSVGIVGVCGDANNSGLMDMDDVNDIIDYLYNDGLNMCPVLAGDMDQFIGTNINDAYYLYEYVAHMAVFPRCPPFTANIPSSPENIIEIRNCTVRPERDYCRVDFWLNATTPAMSISIPFEYSCATSPIICDSITFGGTGYAHYTHKYGMIDAIDPKAAIGIANTGEAAPGGNPVKVASAWFTVDPSEFEQTIIIDSAACGPNEFIIVSPSPSEPYIPSVSVIPGIDFACGDANDDGGINILDIVFIINYKYKGGPAPEIFESADVNSDTIINILDIVYLINFKYKSGPEPFCL